MSVLGLFVIIVLASESILHAERPATWWHLQGLRHARYQTFDEAIHALPLQLRSNVLANFSTNSPQLASFEAPRCTLYSNDASLLVAVAGAPQGRPSSNLIEVAEFDPAADKYIPHLIRYDAQDKRLIFIENVTTVLPRTHSRHCARCHGEDFRPIFDSYRSWPQSYGSGLVNAFCPETVELKKWASFGRTVRPTGYYAHLPGLKRSLEDMREANERLIHLLNAKNERRIIRKIKNNPVVIEYAKEIFALLMGKKFNLHPSLYFTEDLQRALNTALPELWRNVNDQIEKNQKRKIESYTLSTRTVLNKNSVYDFDRPAARFYAELKFFMDLAGVSMSDWAMTLEESQFSFADPTQIFEHLAYEFFTHVLRPYYPSAAKAFEFAPAPTKYGSVQMRVRIEDEVTLNRVLVDLLRGHARACEPDLVYARD